MPRPTSAFPTRSIACPGVPFRDIRRVFSHPVALNQCVKFFRENPQLERVPFYDTAGSVKMLMEERPTDAAAIASSMAADCTARRFSNGHRGRPEQLHPIFPAEAARIASAEILRCRMEDMLGFPDSESSWSVVPMLKRFRFAGHQLYENRVSTGSRETLGVLVLPRFSGRADDPCRRKHSGISRRWSAFFACWAPIRRRT